MLINVLKKDDGFWIIFKAKSGVEAMVHHSKLLNSAGGIVDKAIMEVLEEASQTANSTPSAINEYKLGWVEALNSVDGMKEEEALEHFDECAPMNKR